MRAWVAALALLGVGCAFSAGPVRFAFGQAASSSCEEYTIDSDADRTTEHFGGCTFTHGGPLSGNAISVFDAIRSVAGAIQ